jgi:hypothetical protein
MIEDVVRDAEPISDGTRVADVAPGAAGARTLRRLAMVVELERDADHLGTAARGERGHDRAVDPARHRHDDAPRAGRELEIYAVHDAPADTPSGPAA